MAFGAVVVRRVPYRVVLSGHGAHVRHALFFSCFRLLMMFICLKYCIAFFSFLSVCCPLEMSSPTRCSTSLESHTRYPFLTHYLSFNTQWMEIDDFSTLSHRKHISV